MKVGPQVLLKYGSDPSLKAVEALGFEPAWRFNLMHLSLLVVNEHARILKSHASGHFVKGLEEEVGVFYELEGDRNGIKVLIEIWKAKVLLQQLQSVMSFGLAVTNLFQLVLMLHSAIKALLELL